MFEAKYEPIFIEEKLIKEIESFWEYFSLEEEKLISSLYNRDRDYIMMFERRLEQVFYRNKNKLCYTFKKEEDTIVFTLYFGRSSYLLTVGNELFANKCKKLINKWSFILLK